MKTSNYYELLIKKESKYYLVFSVFAILIPVLSLVVSWMPEGETAASWFQRSGSAMVIFSLLAETRAINLYNILNPSGFVEVGFDDAKEKYNKHHVAFHTSSFILIAIGTFIWGYGDILVNNI